MFVAEDRGGIANGLPISLTGGPVTLNNGQVTGNTAGHGWASSTTAAR